MTFLIIMGIISAMTLIMSVLFVIDTVYNFRAKYPNVRVPKRSPAGLWKALLDMIIVSVLPIFNIIFLLYIVFKGTELQDSVIENLRKKYCISTTEPSDN